MFIKTKNDINYFKFVELSKIIDGSQDARVILDAVVKVFNPKNVKKFAVALSRGGRLIRRFDLDLNFKAGRFIDADTFRADGDQLGMFKSILNPRRNLIGKKYKVEDLSVREAEHILKDWNAFLTDLKLRYEYVFNPPVRARTGGTTQGSAERQAFAEHYGGYAEMTYILSRDFGLEPAKIWEWEADLFLFWGEYLLRKRDVENLK